jgi:hypothetical protein
MPYKKYTSLQTKAEEILKSTHTKILFLREDATVLIQKDKDPKVGEYTVPNATADKIEKEIRDSSYNDIILNFLKQKNYTKESFQGRGFSLLLEAVFDNSDEDLKSLADFIENKNDLTLETHMPGGNVAALAKEKNFSDKMLSNFFSLNELKDSAGNSVGPGEVLFAIIFKDVTNAPGSGDLLVGNKKLEVKKNGARFGQQSGRYPAYSPTMFVDVFIRDKGELQKYISSIKHGRLAAALKNGYNFVTDKKAYTEHVIQKLNEIYSHGQPLAEKYFNEQTFASLSEQDLNKQLFKLYADGYINTDYIMVIDPKFNYVVATKEQFQNLIDNNTVAIRGYFSFQNAFPNFVLKNLIVSPDAEKNNATV